MYFRGCVGNGTHLCLGRSRHIYFACEFDLKLAPLVLTNNCSSGWLERSEQPCSRLRWRQTNKKVSIGRSLVESPVLGIGRFVDCRSCMWTAARPAGTLAPIFFPETLLGGRHSPLSSHASRQPKESLTGKLWLAQARVVGRAKSKQHLMQSKAKHMHRSTIALFAITRTRSVAVVQSR